MPQSRPRPDQTRTIRRSDVGSLSIPQKTELARKVLIWYIKRCCYVSVNLSRNTDPQLALELLVSLVPLYCRSKPQTRDARGLSKVSTNSRSVWMPGDSGLIARGPRGLSAARANHIDRASYAILVCQSSVNSILVDPSTWNFLSAFLRNQRGLRWPIDLSVVRCVVLRGMPLFPTLWSVFEQIATSRSHNTRKYSQVLTGSGNSRVVCNSGWVRRQLT